MAIPSFSEIARYRDEAPSLKMIAVTHDLIGRHGTIATVLQRHLELISRKKSFKVLDIGAYDRAFGRALENIHLPCRYYSLDIDNSMDHEFHGLDEVNESFDVVSMFELIEHLPYEQVDEMLHEAYALVEPDGRLFISTPNPFHPTRYFSDVSHKQHWPPNDLYALLRHVGFAEENIQLFGVIYLPSDPLRRCITQIRNLIWRLIGFDIRGGILAIATK
jgi:SAM-dependent methyltransferase